MLAACVALYALREFDSFTVDGRKSAGSKLPEQI